MSKMEYKKVANTAYKPDVDQGAGYCFVKLKGLPWKATEKEIAKFLEDCRIVGNIFIIKDERGRPSGDAVVKLMEKSDLERALKCNRKYLHDRFVVIEESEKDTFYKHIGKIEEDKIPEKENAFLKMNGLSWAATVDDIKTLLFDCKIREVVITSNESGKPSGNAFVHLDNKADAEKARAHNKEHIHGRFVIVEVIEEEQFTMETERDRKEYSASHVKLSSLPWSSSELDIHAFLRDCSIKKVIFLKNRIGKPSGKALVELQSKGDQDRALILNKSLMGSRNVAVEKVETKDLDKLNGITELKTQETKIVKKTREKDVKIVKVIEEENHKTSCVRNKNTFKFEIKLWDEVSDEEDILEDCKDIELEGVIWEKGEIIRVSSCKSKIILGCAVQSGDIEAETIRKTIENLEPVEDVKIIL